MQLLYSKLFLFSKKMYAYLYLIFFQYLICTLVKEYLDLKRLGLVMHFIQHIFRLFKPYLCFECFKSSITCC